jgi:hypothetical protein
VCPKQPLSGSAEASAERLMTSDSEVAILTYSFRLDRELGGSQCQ